jgi:hypothetical protein
MTFEPVEFICRFLLHVPPRGVRRIRHYGQFASAARKHNIARPRQLLAMPQPTIRDAIESEAIPEPSFHLAMTIKPLKRLESSPDIALICSHVI